MAVNRPDCDDFEMKTSEWQCGDCQTDGHYLCVGCKHIASFDDMELSDNRERYYPRQYKEHLEQERTESENEFSERVLSK